MAIKTQTTKSADLKVKADALNLKPAGELAEMAKKLRLEISKNYLEIKAGRLKNTRTVFYKRKQLARILTALQDKLKV